MMKRLRTLLPLLLLLLALPAVGLGCQQRTAPKPVTLQYWRVFDSEDTMKDIIAAYHKLHPYVSIEYKKLRFEEYEQLMLEALAEDRGPDLFSIHNTWIGKYQSKIAPLPATTTVAEATTTGDNPVYATKTTATATVSNIRQAFIDAVGKDVIRKDTDKKEKIYGLPLGVDTLALFYNRDILNSAGIATPPEDWTQFLAAVSRITKLSEAGQIVVAGASLGTASNVPRFSDILSLLMMQNGANMTDDNGYATFQLVPSQFPNKSFVPGLEALRFYTDFANPTKEAYTWNKEMPDGLEAFLSGRTAFFFGYSYQIPTIRSRAPQLNWDIAPVPQADAVNNRVNFANYWIETVSKKSTKQDIAWDFLQFAARAEQDRSYLAASGKPPALRSLIDEQKGDPMREPFASELLTSRSWYRGVDPAAAESALGDLITAVVDGTTDLKNAVGNAVERINQTIK
ncbi:MAG: extracellular solute-binding protein [Patescibacteria group bacterium]